MWNPGGLVPAVPRTLPEPSKCPTWLEEAEYNPWQWGWATCPLGGDVEGLSDKLSHCSVSQLYRVQKWWTGSGTHQFRKKKVLCLWGAGRSPRIDISHGTSDMALCLCESVVDRWRWWMNRISWWDRSRPKPAAACPERASESVCNLWLLVSLKLLVPKQINICPEQLILVLIWEIDQEVVDSGFVFEGRKGNVCGLLKLCFVFPFQSISDLFS